MTKTSLQQDLTLLGISFALIFLGYAGVQQYVTSYFAEQGQKMVGFYSLLLIYLFLALFSHRAAWLVQRYGPKKVMLLSSIVYTGYIVSLSFHSIILILFSSALLGIAAAHLWVAQQSYLLRMGEEHSYGKRTGRFASLQLVGPLIGIFFLGFLAEKTSFITSFVIYAFFPLLGFLLLLFLQERKISDQARLPEKSSFQDGFRNSSVFRLSTLWFTFAVVFGVMVSRIPLQINASLGVRYVGVLSSLFYLVPIVTSSSWGTISDLVGRERVVFWSYGMAGFSILALFFSDFSPIFLLVGMLLLAITKAMITPIQTALVGDVAATSKIESFSAMSLTAQHLGVIVGLLAASVNSIHLMYALSLLIVVFSFFFVYPLLKMKFSYLRSLELK